MERDDVDELGKRPTSEQSGKRNSRHFTYSFHIKKIFIITNFLNYECHHTVQVQYRYSVPDLRLFIYLRF